MAHLVEGQVQKLLEEHNYNTVGNLLTMYRSYRRSGYANFLAFFQSYTPPITVQHHTCVGLCLELWRRLHTLNATFPGFSAAIQLASCEENILKPPNYVTYGLDPYIVEKEHVLLCLKVRLRATDRCGILLCDPGYHVGRVVTVMADRAYPHTGWFLQSTAANGSANRVLRKEYNYQMSALNAHFIEWLERTTVDDNSGGGPPVVDAPVSIATALVYVGRPYLTAVDVTERRNLVYDFRSLVRRDTKGHLLAGLYFKLANHCDEFTVFYHDMGKQRVKMAFSAFRRHAKLKINESLLNIIAMCNEQMNLPDGNLLEMLCDLAELMDDKMYLRQLLEVNSCIVVVSVDN